MTEVTARYPMKSDGSAYRKGKLSNGTFGMDKKGPIDRKLTDSEYEFKRGAVDLEGSKRELTKMKTQNKDLEKQIQTAENEMKSLQTKIGALRVKLGLANANLNTTNDEKESLRIKLDAAQIHVARLEERLTHSSSELERLRDPANPDSNMSIKKHIANDKKEIKRLKGEIETELNALDIDNNESDKKRDEIEMLERQLRKRQESLDTMELELTGVQAIEEAEKQKKTELIDFFGELNHERKSYPTRLKHLKVRLGISNAGQNVSTKLADDMKYREKEMQRELNAIERKLKEAAGSLDVLRNQHKMSKTAQSINQYTRRTQMFRGVEDIKSMAQSGPGPVKFGPSKRSKDQSKVKSVSGGSSLTVSDTSSRPTDHSRNRDNASVKSHPMPAKGKRRDSEATVIKKGDSNKNEHIVPQPKAKMRR